MFIESFITTCLATMQIFILGSCGFVLVKRKVVDEKGLALLATLLINFFVPQFIYVQLTGNFSYEAVPHWWLFPLLSIGMTAVGILLSQVVLTASPSFAYKNQFRALVGLQNAGFVPLMIVTVLFSGAEAQTLYVYIFLFIIGFDLQLWTLGVWLLTKNQVTVIEFKKMLNPPLIAIWASMSVIALGWHHLVPQVVLKPVTMFSDCTLPFAMIVVGGNLAMTEVGNIEVKETALFVLTKLVLMPLLALGIVHWLRLDFLLGALIVLQAATPSAVSLSVITRHYDVEEKFVNHGIFFSHTLSMITLPIFLSIYLWMYT